MKKLKETFRRNGLLYTQIEKNDFVGLYSVGGHFSDKTTHYEVCKIYIRNDKYGIRESLPSDSLFGKDLSRCFPNLEAAMKYYTELSDRYILLQRVPESVSESDEKLEVISEY